MRKLTAAITVLFLISILFASCTQSKNVDLDALMANINEKFELPDMMPVTSPEELYTLFQIDEKDASAFSAAYSSDSTKREEIILIEAKNAASAENIEMTLFNRLDSFLSGSKSYSPEEYAMLEKCAVNTYRDVYVTLVICEQSQDIDKYIKETIG